MGALSACTVVFGVAQPTTAPNGSTAPVEGSAAACAPNIDEIVAQQDTQSTDAVPNDLADRYDAAAAAVFEHVLRARGRRRGAKP